MMLEQRRNQEYMNAQQQNNYQRIKRIEEMLLSSQRGALIQPSIESNSKAEQSAGSPTWSASQQVGGPSRRNMADGRPRTVQCYNF